MFRARLEQMSFHRNKKVGISDPDFDLDLEPGSNFSVRL